MGFNVMNPPVGAHVCSEGNGTISREQVVLKSGSGMLMSGLVLGRITAAGADLGKFAPYSNAATNGTQVVAGVLFSGVDATSADARGVAHVRHCELFADRLVWPAGTSESDKAAGLADLATLGVIVR